MPKPRDPHPAPEPPSVTVFLEKLSASLGDGTFVRLVLSSPTAVGADHPVRVTGRLVEVRDERHLSLVSRFSARDVTQNHPAPVAAQAVGAMLGTAFRSALLETTQRDWLLHVPTEGPPRLKGHRPRTLQAPARQHDQPRESWLDASATSWLKALGILDAGGRPRASLADKHRQIDRYIEILSHLARDCGWAPEQPLQVIDVGCGKGHLTFGAWHLFHQRLRLNVKVLGIELRPGLVDHANQVARTLGAEGLAFQYGSIEAATLPAADALIALHACNTATDDAILRAIDGGARLVVLAPCCHQELRPQLGHPEPLAPILRQGLMQERLAEWLTDGLRALFLEWAGYETKIIEFVSPEHTAKNLLLAGILRHPPFSLPEARERILDLKRFFSLGPLRLDPLLERPSSP